MTRPTNPGIHVDPGNKHVRVAVIRVNGSEDDDAAVRQLDGRISLIQPVPAKGFGPDGPEVAIGTYEQDIGIAPWTVGASCDDETAIISRNDGGGKIVETETKRLLEKTL